MKNITYILILVVLVGGYFLLKSRGEKLVSPVESPIVLPADSGIITEEPVILEDLGEVETQEEAQTQNVITYTSGGFSPSVINVKKGGEVTFLNKSEGAMWPASAIHPTHTLYPTQGGCVGSTFDACQGIEPGEAWSFKFDIAGSFKYHNHLNPSQTGTVVVED